MIKTNSLDILNKLQNDFSYFLYNAEKDKNKRFFFEIDVLLEGIPKDLIPALKATSQSLNSITYDYDDVRYNDYYGEVLSVYNYKTNKADLYSLNLERLHEITYLLILSRVGEVLEQKGFHKIHACSISYQGRAFIIMMPMKGGKSTLFLNLIKNQNFKIISDDTPLINKNGKIFPFPLRLGINHIPEYISFDPKYIDKIKREYYGEKFLIDLRAFKNSISEPCNKIVLINGIRYSKGTTKIEKCSKLAMIKPLLVHMIVGLGLPIILEYFLHFSSKDIVPKTRILISRICSAFFLLIKADTYVLELGSDQYLASETVIRFIINRPLS